MKHSQTESLLQIYQAGLQAVDGKEVVAQHLRQDRLKGTVMLVAVGKAAQAMALGAQDVLGEQISDGLVISKTGHIDYLDCKRYAWDCIEAGHPVPDTHSLQAGESLQRLLVKEEAETLLFLISGGASSLLECPVDGVDLAFLIRTNTWLHSSGLAIDDMNRVRKGLSRIKGGGLLQLTGNRRVRVLAISDVPGDDPAVIGSGLLVPDYQLQNDLSRLDLPTWLQSAIKHGLDARSVPTTHPPQVEIVANLTRAKQAAADKARAMGYTVHLVEEFVSGDAAEAGRRLASELLKGEAGVTIWGGETTVRLPPHPGRGGRNQHLALAAAQILQGQPRVWLLAAGTDGTDGPTVDAGAIVDGGTIERAEAEGFQVAQALIAADAGPLLEASGDLITTGPTGTNVMDLMIGLKE